MSPEIDLRIERARENALRAQMETATDSIKQMGEAIRKAIPALDHVQPAIDHMAKVAATREEYRVILATPDLLERLGMRTLDGKRVVGKWGTPDENGWYTPTFEVQDDGMIVVDYLDLQTLADAATRLESTLRRVLDMADESRDDPSIDAADTLFVRIPNVAEETLGAMEAARNAPRRPPRGTPRGGGPMLSATSTPGGNLNIVWPRPGKP